MMRFPLKGPADVGMGFAAIAAAIWQQFRAKIMAARDLIATGSVAMQTPNRDQFGGPDHPIAVTMLFGFGTDGDRKGQTADL